MYITLTYEDGTKISKEIDSSSTIAIDGVTRNASGETVVGPSVYTGSCEGLTRLAVTTSDESTQGQDTSPVDSTDPDHTAVVAGLQPALDAVASAESDEDHQDALEKARADIDRALALWPESQDLADAKMQLEELASARVAIAAAQVPPVEGVPDEQPVVEPHVASSEKSVEAMRDELVAAATSEEQAAAIKDGTDADIRDLYAAFIGAGNPPQA